MFLLEPATADHLHQLADMINQAYRGEGGWTSEAGLVTGLRTTAAKLEGEMASGEYRYFVCYADDTLVGCCNLQLQPTVVEIGGFTIIPAWQGKGVGSQMLAQAEILAARLRPGLPTAVRVLTPREDLIAYFVRRGYQKTGRVDPYPVGQGVGEPLVEQLTLVQLQKTVATVATGAAS